MQLMAGEPRFFLEQREEFFLADLTTLEFRPGIFVMVGHIELRDEAHRQADTLFVRGEALEWAARDHAPEIEQDGTDRHASPSPSRNPPTAVRNMAGSSTHGKWPAPS